MGRARVARGAPLFQVSPGPEARSGARAAGVRVGSGEASEGPLRGAVRGLSTPGPGSTRGPAGSWRCERRCGIARGRTSCARLTAGAAVGGEPAKEQTRRQAGDRSRTHGLARHAGPAGGLHFERRRGTARGRDSCTWAAGWHRAGAAGRCAGGGWHRGGRRGTARGLTASLGLRAGLEPAPRGEGERVAGGRCTAFPQGNFKLAGACSLAGTRQVLVASGWAQQHGGGSPLAGRAAEERVGAGRGPEGGQGGRKGSGA